MIRLLVASLFLCSTTFAGEFKYVDTRAVFVGTDEGKQTLSVLQKDYQAKQEEVQTKAKIFDGKMAEFKTSSETLTKELKADKEKELNEKYAELNALSDKYWKEFTKARDESFVAFKKKFAVVIQELVAAKKIDFILDKEAFIYYPAKMDLTDEVIKTYNKKYPVAKESK